MYRDKSERGPKITKAIGLKKLLEKLESGELVLDKKKQMALPGGILEDDLNTEQYKQAVKILIKEDSEKVVETPVVVSNN
jgi:alkyl hydroperoxide reductase subunit AhpF